MGEEVRMTEYVGAGGGIGGEDERVSEWELGLPNSDDITPLSHQLIPPELASAFSISPEPYRSVTDVNRASQNTISSICGGQHDEDDGSDPRKIRRIDSPEEAENADEASKGLKRPRLVWTPQLHKRFVDVVGHLGLKNAVPKTIMQLMNVEGLTRENVASHLQKYRLYLKRMSHDEGPSESESGGGGGHVAMPVMMHMPMIPGKGAFPWMQQQKEAFGSVGSYHHHQHAGSSDK